MLLSRISRKASCLKKARHLYFILCFHRYTGAPGMFPKRYILAIKSGIAITCRLWPAPKCKDISFASTVVVFVIIFAYTRLFITGVALVRPERKTLQLPLPEPDHVQPELQGMRLVVQRRLRRLDGVVQPKRRPVQGCSRERALRLPRCNVLNLII